MQRFVESRSIMQPSFADLVEVKVKDRARVACAVFICFGGDQAGGEKNQNEKYASLLISRASGLAK